jgi:hypothetical protein
MKDHMNKILALISCSALILAITSCRTIKTITGSDTELKKIGDLWSDVPRMEGLTSSEADLPMFVKLLMRTALNNLYRLNKEGENQTPATGDWAAFSTTKSAQDVQNYYSNERLTSFGNWDASKNSTCLNGKDQGFNGIACVFHKNANKKDIGLLVVAAQDDQKKQTNVFFVRVESPESSKGTPQTNSNTSPSTSTEIKPLVGSAPYEIEKRPMPNGLNLDELLPKQVGPFSRTLVEKSDKRGETATSIEVDGNSVYATYKAGDKEVFLEFAIGSKAESAQSVLELAAGEMLGKFPSDPSVGSIRTEPSFLRVADSSSGFFAWTRGNYYFSVDAKGGQADLDEFMQAFPF